MIRQTIKSALLGRYLYGNLKDSDRIFTNVYKDGDPYINGALKRVQYNLLRGTGIELKTLLPTGLTG